MDTDALADALDEYDQPLQDLISDLLKEYYTGEEHDIALAAMAARRRRLENEADQLKAQKQHINTQLSEIRTELQYLDELADEVTEDAKIDEVITKIADIPEQRREPTNKAIQTQADKVGLDPQRLLALLEERYPTDRFGEPEHLTSTEATGN